VCVCESVCVSDSVCVCLCLYTMCVAQCLLQSPCVNNFGHVQKKAATLVYMHMQV
jgi:hypothetical protein